MSAPVRTKVRSKLNGVTKKLENLEIVIQLPSRKKQNQVSTKSKKDPDGTLLILPTIVKIGIVASIEKGLGSIECIGAKSSANALVAGNVVALFVPSPYGNPIGAFLRVKDDEANCGGGERCLSQLPLDWRSERFLVVDAGHGEVAFYNICHRLFLGADTK